MLRRRHVLLLHGVRQLRLSYCCPAHATKSIASRSSAPVDEACAGVSSLLAGWAVASDESIATHNFLLPIQASVPTLNRRTHCSVPLPALYTHAPRNIINHYDRRRSSCASTTEILPIDHWRRSGGSDTRASSTLSPHSATVTLATAVATFGARLRQTRRDF